MSRGAFFDRRAFLISYDPTIDADGAILLPGGYEAIGARGLREVLCPGEDQEGPLEA